MNMTIEELREYAIHRLKTTPGILIKSIQTKESYDGITIELEYADRYRPLAIVEEYKENTWNGLEVYDTVEDIPNPFLYDIMNTDNNT